jgi:hypothetical protein
LRFAKGIERGGYIYVLERSAVDANGSSIPVFDAAQGAGAMEIQITTLIY